jgi:multidrug efflux pump subunit AcrA (membrane-fusion protein)
MTQPHPKTQKRPQTLILLITAATLALTSCSSNKPAAPKDQAASEKSKSTPVVSAQEVAVESISDLYAAPGVVKGDGVVAVPAFSEGIVDSCRVGLGQSVKKGDTLCSINNDNPTATYLPFQAISPATGVIGEIKVAIGSRVNKGDTILTIVRPSIQRVEIEVPVADAQAIRKGTKANWRHLANKNSEPLELRVVGVSPLPDPLTRTIRIELEPRSTGNIGPSGTIGKVEFNLNNRSGIEVSEEALQYRSIEPFLRVIQDGKIQWKPVKIGRVQNGKAEILQGVASGQSIVVASPKFLVDGDEVTVQKGKVSAK